MLAFICVKIKLIRLYLLFKLFENTVEFCPIVCFVIFVAVRPIFRYCVFGGRNVELVVVLLICVARVKASLLRFFVEG